MEFDVLDKDLGSGEFGRVLKVRRKAGDGNDFGLVGAEEGDAYAIEKSKPIEGAKHRYDVPLFLVIIQETNYHTVVRLRLREEVDILKQLKETSEGRRGHPNVLRYIDNWEQGGLSFI